MSHTLRYGDTIFHYNSDLSGDVTIFNTKSTEAEFNVKGEYLFNFIAEYVRRTKIEKLENMSPRKVLGIPPRYSCPKTDDYGPSWRCPIHALITVENPHPADH